MDFEDKLTGELKTRYEAYKERLVDHCLYVTRLEGKLVAERIEHKKAQDALLRELIITQESHEYVSYLV